MTFETFLAEHVQEIFPGITGGPYPLSGHYSRRVMIAFWTFAELHCEAKYIAPGVWSFEEAMENVYAPNAHGFSYYVDPAALRRLWNMAQATVAAQPAPIVIRFSTYRRVQPDMVRRKLERLSEAFAAGCNTHLFSRSPTSH